MLDINFIREQSEIVKKACTDKNLDSKVVDDLLIIDAQRRELIQKVENLRSQSNRNAQEVKQQVGAEQKPVPELISKGKDLKRQIKALEPELKQVESSFTQLMYEIPSVPATDTPLGRDESGNQVMRQVGEKIEFKFVPHSHEALMQDLDILDTKKAVKMAGFRAYFLKGDGLLLEQALLKYALDLLMAEGFTPMSVPVMVNQEAMLGTGYFPWGSEDHYQTQDGQILTGTAEVALTAYHQGEILNEADLPIKICGISPCFRREVGSYGKDTKGIIRVHQFNKVEQVVLTVADENITRDWHERMVALAEKLLQNLGLPYQVLAMCTGDMGAGQRKKYDLETWFPSQNKYRETHSASYFNDFQSRRLNIRYQDQDGNLKFVYTLNNTMAASPRLLAAVIENYQQADGSIKIPEVLRQYMGKDVIN